MITVKFNFNYSHLSIIFNHSMCIKFYYLEARSHWCYGLSLLITLMCILVARSDQKHLQYFSLGFSKTEREFLTFLNDKQLQVKNVIVCRIARPATGHAVHVSQAISH